MNNLIIRGTPKGSRIFLEALAAKGFAIGASIAIEYTKDAIIITKDSEGKRKVSSPSHGGVIDLQSNKVTKWAQGSTRASVDYSNGSIVITRGNA